MRPLSRRRASRRAEVRTCRFYRTADSLYCGWKANFHTFRYRIYARRYESSRARSLYEAYAAGAFGTFAVIERTKRRDFVTALFGGLEYSKSRLYLIRYAFYFNIYHSLIIHLLPFGYSLKLTGGYTHTALNALVLIDNERLFADHARNGVDGAVPCAKTALFAFFGVDFVTHKMFTNVRGAVFVNDMRYILVLKVSESGKYGVGSGLTESAKRVAPYVFGKVFKGGQIVHSRLTAGYFV